LDLGPIRARVEGERGRVERQPLSAFHSLDCFTHTLIIGGPRFSFLGLCPYRLYS